MTAADILEAWNTHLAQSRRRSPHTVRAYAATAARLLHTLPAEQSWESLARLDAGTLRTHLAERRADGLGNVSAARELSALKTFIAFAREQSGGHNGNGDLGRPRLRGPRVKKGLPRPITPDEAVNLAETVADDASQPWIAARDRAVLIGDRRWDFAVSADGIEYWLTAPDGKKLLVESGWKPGMSLCIARVDGVLHHVRLDRRTAGWRLRYRGADLTARVLLPRAADLMVLMPVKLPPDMSRFLLCPMPGQVVRIDVAEGDIVEDGQPLAIVEAMKMENVLKAEKRARVKTIRVKPGAVLAVDEVILEFEGL